MTPALLVVLAAVALPESFELPPAFVVHEKASSVWAFDHEPVSTPKEKLEPEGKTWRLMLNLKTPNKTSNATDAQMREALTAQGWELLTPSGTLVARRVVGPKTVWFKGFAESGDFRAVIIEVGPAPHPLTLTAPAATPETFGEQDDFPWLQKFPGSTLSKSSTSSGLVNVTADGAAETTLVGNPVLEKQYQLPQGTSSWEFVTVYRDALTRAGWTVLHTAAGSDALVTAHYAKNGRDLYCYLHGGTFVVADVGAQSESKALADALEKDGHVPVYGIYFDVDKATLKPESEIALAHVLELLVKSPKLSLEVQGHTDNTGTPPHNAKLSEERAASVTKWLVDHRVAAARLTPKGFGETRPVADNSTPDGRAKNRRVELAKRK